MPNKSRISQSNVPLYQRIFRNAICFQPNCLQRLCLTVHKNFTCQKYEIKNLSKILILTLWPRGGGELKITIILIEDE